MLRQREELERALCAYATDTLTCIHTVKDFCEVFSKWKHFNDTELYKMIDIKDGIDTLDLTISHVCNSEEKGKTFLKFMKSKVNTDSKRAELEKDLTKVLEHILSGLETLSCFLDAVEKLAVTSVYVFAENQVLHLPEGINFKQVESLITAAYQICPLLLEFKRDANDFFLPKLENLDVLKYQLERYIQITQKICEKLEESSIRDLSLMTCDVVVDLDVDLCKDITQRMLCHIYMLDKIRMDPNFRMVVLFKEGSCQDFVNKFDERQPRMLEFLNELETCALKLDSLSKVAKISSVAGTSVGIVGSILSIVGLALIPVTAGVSFSLTMAGVGLGIGSAVSGGVTTGVEIGVNATQQRRANQVFQNFMEDVQSLQDCLQEETNRHICKEEVLQSENQTTGNSTPGDKGAQTFRNASRMASDIPEIGEAAIRGSLAASRSARAAFIAVNALFLGMDIFFICRDGISLAKGSKSKISQLIRARSALWSSEITSWQKIRDSLEKGLLTSEKKNEILQTSFYPEMRKLTVKNARPSIHYHNHTHFTSVIQSRSYIFQTVQNLPHPTLDRRQGKTCTSDKSITELTAKQFSLIVIALAVFLWFILRVCDAAFSCLL